MEESAGRGDDIRDVLRLCRAKPNEGTRAFPASAAVEQRDVVPGFVDEPRPRKHLLAISLEAVQQHDRGRAGFFADEPGGPPARSRDVDVGPTAGRARIARMCGDEEISVD